MIGKSREGKDLNISDAIEIIRSTVLPTFHGKVIVNIKDGGISTVEIRQILVTPKKAA